MGKLNVVISDEIDTKFRQEVFKRKGMKKGNLTEALEEAMALWIKSDVIERIRQKALSKGVTSTELKQLVDALTTQGTPSLPALGDLLNKKGLQSAELGYITEAIQKVSSRSGLKPAPLHLRPSRSLEPSSPV